MKLILAILITIVLVLGVAIVAVVYFGAGLPKEVDAPGETKNDAENQNQVYYQQESFTDSTLRQEFLSIIDQEEPLGGYIYTTSIKKRPGAEEPFDEKGNLFTPSTYVFEAGVGDIDYQFTHPIWFLNGDVVADHIYVTIPIGATEYVSRVLIDHGPQHAKKINETADPDLITGVRLPRWSNDYKNYLYTAYLGDPSIDPMTMLDSPSAWRIYTGPNDDSYQSFYFADGYGGQWANNDKNILYIRKEGIFTKRYVGNESRTQEPEAPLLSSYGPFGIRNEMTVSPDGHYLAVTYPFASQVGASFIEIYKLSFSEADPSAELVQRILYDDGVPLLSPIFSPNGRYLVAISNDLTAEANNHLVAYDLVDNRFIWEADFSNFYIGNTFITDWVKKPESQ